MSNFLGVAALTVSAVVPLCTARVVLELIVRALGRSQDRG